MHQCVFGLDKLKDECSNGKMNIWTSTDRIIMENFFSFRKCPIISIDVDVNTLTRA